MCNDALSINNKVVPSCKVVGRFPDSIICYLASVIFYLPNTQILLTPVRPGDDIYLFEMGFIAALLLTVDEIPPKHHLTKLILRIICRSPALRRTR